MALKCYKFFSKYNQNQKNKDHDDDGFCLEEQMKIYLQKDESIFTKYGDEEAEYYEKMMLLEEEKKKKQREERKDRP